MVSYGKLSISQQEKDERPVAVREALAITRLEGAEPGPFVLAVYEQYIAGDIDRETCEQQVKEAAIFDLKVEEGLKCKNFHTHTDVLEQLRQRRESRDSPMLSGTVQQENPS